MDLLEDVLHCGGCGRECDTEGVQDWFCEDGVCTSTCTTGRANCWQPVAPQPDDGCETDILNEVLNCGGCERACLTTQGVDQARCDAGVCTSTCLPGYLNVNRPVGSAPDDGCEVEDVANCGEQGRECAGTNVAALSCSAGVCTSTCLPGYLNVNHPVGSALDDGCELDTWTDADNCGEQGRECAGTNVAVLSCGAGVCTSTCLPGHLNVNRPGGSMSDDGCELEDVTNCGGQGRPCAETNVATLSCNAGVCTSTCLPGHLNVNRPGGTTPDDGCELDTLTDANNCGAQGRECAETNVVTPSCNAGVCTSTCLPGYLNVNRPGGTTPDDGCELDTLTDEDNCGGEGRECVGTNVATRSCNAGVCTSTCLPGYLNVNRPGGSAPDDGCELDTWTDEDNCGEFGRVCASTHVAARRCEGGLCTSTCDVGYGNSNRPAAGSPDDGCEAVCPATPGASPMVMLPEGYCIDQTEVTQGQYAAWLNGTPAPSTAGQDTWCTWNTSYAPDTSGSCDWDPVSRANYPVVCVDWCDAYAYCEGVGKRMCGNRAGGPNGYYDYTNAGQSQWHNACVSGAADNAYPYGDLYEGTRCNGHDYSLTDDAPVEVGTLSTCRSPLEGYGDVYDLSGNEWEWEDSCGGQVDRSDYCRLRGGAFYYDMEFMRCDAGHETNRDYRGVDVGIRCCAP